MPTPEWYAADSDDEDRVTPRMGHQRADLSHDDDRNPLEPTSAYIKRLTTTLKDLRDENQRLRQGLWDSWAALGGDTDGDPGPGAWIAGSGVDGFIAAVIRDAAQWRKETEDDYDADTSALEAEIARLTPKPDCRLCGTDHA